jgi:hypothetical protein
MNLLAPVNRDPSGRPFDSSARTLDDVGGQAGSLPLDPASLLGLFAHIHALGLAQLAGSGAANASDVATSAAANAPLLNTDLARRRYVSGIADQGGDETDAVLPAALRASIVGGAPGLGHTTDVVPVQFRSVMRGPRGAPFGIPSAEFGEQQKNIARGLMGIWKSIQERANSLNGGNGGPDRSADTPAPWLTQATPLGIILGHIAEMSRKSGGRKDKASDDFIPFKLSPSITPPEGPDSNDACVKAASGSELAWQNYCRTVADPQERAVCWSKQNESAQNKIGWCASRFAD